MEELINLIWRVKWIVAIAGIISLSITAMAICLFLFKSEITLDNLANIIGSSLMIWSVIVFVAIMGRMVFNIT